MPRTGCPKAKLSFEADERDRPTRWAGRARSSQALALRSRIVLACADGADNKPVAAELAWPAGTVGRGRAGSRAGPRAGRGGGAASGRPASVGVDQVEEVVVAA